MSALIILLVIFIAYLFPSLVAHMRGHRNENAIFLLNLFFGWSILGWFAALIWSATSNVGPQ